MRRNMHLHEDDTQDGEALVPLLTGMIGGMLMRDENVRGSLKPFSMAFGPGSNTIGIGFEESGHHYTIIVAFTGVRAQAAASGASDELQPMGWTDSRTLAERILQETAIQPVKPIEASGAGTAAESEAPIEE